MFDFPVHVRITIPTRIERRRGRDSTVLPFGMVTSIRTTEEELSMIDRARRITGFDISRGGFIRVAAYRVAQEICNHHDKHSSESDNGTVNRDDSGNNE
jgi:hypothetical protein